MTDFFAALGEFHFLRPLWFLALLLLPALIYIAKHSTKNNSSWAQAINPKLLQYLLDDQTTPSNKWLLYLFISGCALSLIALAGPVSVKMPQPVHQADDGLVIVLDQSLSMQATDLKPSRQVAVQHKLTDLLKARQEGQTALLVYAGDAHVVSPLTDDTDTILAMVPALSPLIMPALGSRVETGIALAKQLLKDGNVNDGRILLITDGIQNKDIKAIKSELSASGHRLSIMVVGTAAGGPIPLPDQGFLRDNDDIVIAKTNMQNLRQLALVNNALIASLSLDNSDIDTLIPSRQFDLNAATHEVERELDQWREEGSWLVLLLLPFAALAFRRGWLLSLFLMVLIQPSQTQALEGTKELPPQDTSPVSTSEPETQLWSNLWKTADQQGAKAFTNKDYETASKQFESPQWQGSAAYRAGDFKNAAKYFAEIDNAQAHYNRGNALAKAGKLEKAVAAYEQALQHNPELVDAKINKKLVEQLQQSLPQNKSSEQQNSDQSNADQQQSESDDSEQQQSQNKSQNDKQRNSSDSSQQQQTEQESQQDNSVQEEQEQQQEKEGKAEQASEESDQSDAQNNEQARGPVPISELSAEEQQAMEQWLRRIPDDPSGLLKRKFNYQYQQNKRNNQFIPQEGNEAIW